MYDDNPDEPHDREAEGTYAEFLITFDVTEDEDGNMHSNLVNVQSHIHHVPDHVVVDTLLIVARNMLARGRIHEIFSGDVPDEIRDTLINGLAGMLLKQRLDSPEVMGVGMESIHVPNDISELLDD